MQQIERPDRTTAPEVRLARERELEAAEREAAARFAVESGRARRISWARLALVALVVGGAIAGVRAITTWPALILAAALFVGLVAVHRRADAAARDAEARVAACRAARARMRRAWSGIPPLRTPPVAQGNRDSRDGRDDRDAGTSWDLGILGDVSLFRLLDVGHPALGGACLRAWLFADPPPLATLAARQQSVAALRDGADFLLESAVVARHGARPYRPSGAAHLRQLEAWARAEGTLTSPMSKWSIRALLAIVAATALVAAVRPDLRETMLALLGVLVLAQLAVALHTRARLTREVRGVDDALRDVADVVAHVRLLAAAPDVAGRMGEIQRLLRGDRAAEAFAGLERVLAWNEVRYSPMASFAMNAAVGFDGHLAVAIDAWRRAHGARVGDWLALVAEAQALAALATLAFENPDWCVPQVHDDDGGPMLAADALTHPLLPAAVPNDATVPRAGGVLVVSGANMAGKTTWLRAIGLNALLAQAGGPVAARSCRLRRCRVRTSVRVVDDLAHATSLFLAEVTRLRAIVEDAERRGEAPVLFLLDEMLHGTNAADRRRASERVLQRLLAAPSAGVVTTHDPAMTAEIERDPSATVEHVHFEGQVTRDDGRLRLDFDYALRAGPATGANALAILELLGLGEPARELARETTPVRGR